MERLAEAASGLKLLSIFVKSFILDVWQDSKYAPDRVMSPNDQIVVNKER